MLKVISYKIKMWWYILLYNIIKNNLYRSIKYTGTLTPDILNINLWDCDGYNYWFDPKHKYKIWVKFEKINDQLTGRYNIYYGINKTFIRTCDSKGYLEIYLILNKQ